jgi:hypothetical protein
LSEGHKARAGLLVFINLDLCVPMCTYHMTEAKGWADPVLWFISSTGHLRHQDLFSFDPLYYFTGSEVNAQSDRFDSSGSHVVHVFLDRIRF